MSLWERKILNEANKSEKTIIAVSENNLLDTFLVLLFL